jgi:tRNA threonylcarbamoyladenosine biosynthesis protein TsaE
MTKLVTRSPEETRRAGADFARALPPDAVVVLTGDLGAGKTQFIAGACLAFGVTTPVTSPTFTLVNEYSAPGVRVAHVDLYRINRREELAELGLEEYLNGGWVCFIEWGEFALDVLPRDLYQVTITPGAGSGERTITIAGPAGEGS